MLQRSTRRNSNGKARTITSDIHVSKLGVSGVQATKGEGFTEQPHEKQVIERQGGHHSPRHGDANVHAQHGGTEPRGEPISATTALYQIKKNNENKQTASDSVNEGRIRGRMNTYGCVDRGSIAIGVAVFDGNSFIPILGLWRETAVTVSCIARPSLGSKKPYLVHRQHGAKDFVLHGFVLGRGVQ